VPWVVAPGEEVALHASLPRDARIDIVRIGCGNVEAAGPAMRVEPTPGAPCVQAGAASYPVWPGTSASATFDTQPIPSNATLVVALQRQPRGAPGEVLSLTTASGAGVALSVERIEDAGDCMLQFAARRADVVDRTLAQLRFTPGPWLLLRFGPRAQGGWEVRTVSVDLTVPAVAPLAWSEPLETDPPVDDDAPFVRLTLGARAGEAGCADVRIDLLSLVRPPTVASTPAPESLLRSDWDPTRCGEAYIALRATASGAVSLTDLCRRAEFEPALRAGHGTRGIRWDGRFNTPGQAPDHYSALQLASDEVLDARWPARAHWTVPPDLDSGCYAFRIVDDTGATHHASVFVSGAARPRHRCAVLMSTFTYLAYSNAPEAMRGPDPGGAQRPVEAELDRLHAGLGRSLYERHRDGNGVVWCSSRRPLLSVAPGHRPWGFVADTLLLDWLERSGVAFDVITDHDLHRLGRAALEGFDVVLTGHHPEYFTTPMWDGLWIWLSSGGRLMYLGGNGFYWRTAWCEAAEMIEVRRAEDGTRPHIAPPGESTLAASGEPGGLWRRLGRAPQRLVGVGMAAQGFERATHYRRRTDDPEVAWVFDGVPGSTFGHEGTLGGGASGWEIDRLDYELGTPLATWWLASSEHHDPSMLRTKEELLSYIAPFPDAKARSDVVLAPIGDGDVFSVGSMTWIGSLHGARSDIATDVARITSNVLHRFLDPTPLPRRDPDARHAVSLQLSPSTGSDHHGE
jgi:hypothetical protein